ncbi:MAG: hypothetical protein CMD22_00145 [Flavobacteriales bacterium]|nr:hypothetical protein [Flavobacteriales bacterium]|tara:strand:+ start:744 stop:1652 length:909 start_codon:yes stop_codon:yes gene_type:complete
MYDIPEGHNLSQNENAMTQYWSGIQNMSNDIKGGHHKLYKRAQASFCGDLANYHKNTGDKTCKQLDADKSQLKTWCKQGSNIKGDSKSVCNTEQGNLGVDAYEKIAKEYCNNNPDDDWCQCYNITEQKCLTNPDLPGCEDVADKLETLQEELHPKYWGAFEGTEKCWGNCEKADIFKPNNAIVQGGVCSKAVTICVSNIEAGNLKDSEINVEQKCGSGEKRFNAEGKEVDSMGNVIEGGTTEDPANVPTNNTKTGSKFTTTKIEDIRHQRLYEKQGFQIGSAVAVSSSSCLLVLIIILVMFL